MTRRKVLIGYDHSVVSISAIEWVVKNKIVTADDDITVVIIVNDDAIAVEGAFGLEATTIGLTPWISDDSRHRVSLMEKDSQDALDAVVKWFGKNGIHVKGELFNGEPAETLVAYAEESKVDFVIVGNRGLGFFKRQLIGSVSDYLVHNLKCSVLVVKGDHKASDLK
ncbi:hypothetical protein BDB01DRAFT_846239 [Pilobolus umbonatus]|nr:hypothetical protein BDB01DRAFT_846239 [Pilobolus umbonatus]